MEPSSERADAVRDMLALIRAWHEDDMEATAAILGCVGDRELHAITRVFADAYCDLLTRYVAANQLIEAGPERTFVSTADRATLDGWPGVHANVASLIADLQDRYASRTSA